MAQYAKVEDILKHLKNFDGDNYVISKKAIDGLPAIEIDEDCISRGKLISELAGIWDGYTPNIPRTMLDFQDMLEDIDYKIRNASSIVSKQN